MFIRHFEARAGTPRYERFIKRYWEFRREDCDTICRAHHALAHHFIYGPYAAVIRRHVLRLQKPMSQWTWREADILMRDLRKAYDDWREAQRAICTVKKGNVK